MPIFENYKCPWINNISIGNKMFKPSYLSNLFHGFDCLILLVHKVK